jgi:hypothetical protein
MRIGLILAQFNQVRGDAAGAKRARRLPKDAKASRPDPARTAKSREGAS